MKKRKLTIPTNNVMFLLMMPLLSFTFSEELLPGKTMQGHWIKQQTGGEDASSTFPPQDQNRISLQEAIR
jgi:hypothetical protein